MLITKIFVFNTSNTKNTPISNVPNVFLSIYCYFSIYYYFFSIFVNMLLLLEAYGPNAKCKNSFFIHLFFSLSVQFLFALSSLSLNPFLFCQIGSTIVVPMVSTPCKATQCHCRREGGFIFISFSFQIHLSPISLC